MSRLLRLTALLLLAPCSAWAGTAVGESIWDRNNAIQRAMQSVPSGAQVTNTQCQDIEVGTGNDHYLCQVTYSDPPTPMRPSGGSSAPVGALAPAAPGPP